VNVEPRLIGEVEELIELGQPFRIELARLGKEGTEGDKDAHDIGALPFQSGKVTTRGLGIELLPQLGRPAGAGAVVTHAERHEGFAGGIYEAMVLAVDTDLRGRLDRQRRLGARGRPVSADHGQHYGNNRSCGHCLSLLYGAGFSAISLSFCGRFGSFVKSCRTYGAILFRAEVREVLRAEGPAVHPAKGGALVYRPHRVLYSAVSCGVRPNGPRVRLIAPPGRKAMPQSLARIWLHITFSTEGRRAYLRNPDVREEMFRMLSHPAQDQRTVHGIEEELLARWAGHYRKQGRILMGPLYQGFALRWANGRPFGAHIRRHERGTEA
jgi:hypothetical protein